MYLWFKRLAAINFITAKIRNWMKQTRRDTFKRYGNDGIFLKTFGKSFRLYFRPYSLWIFWPKQDNNISRLATIYWF